MESVSEANHKAEAIQCPFGTMLQENEAVIIAVMATHYTRYQLLGSVYSCSEIYCDSNKIQFVSFSSPPSVNQCKNNRKTILL